MPIRLRILGLVVLCLPAALADTLVFRGATVHPVAGAPIPDGVVVVERGRIAAVGAAGSVRIPSGAEIRELQGKVIVPGLVDTHSHLGRVSGGDASSALNPEVRALDGVDIHADNLWRARSGGLTTINVMPGSGHLMSGQTVYLKLRADPGSIEDWLFCEDPARDVCGSMKMANGTNSIKGKPFPGTRAKSAAMVRELFTKARHYRDERVGEKPPARDLGLEAVVEILERRRRVQFHTHRRDDIATMLRLRDEFDFDVVIQHGSEAWMLAELLAEEGVGVSYTLVDSPGGKQEVLGMRPDAPAILAAAGVEFSFNTDDSITDSRLFLRAAAMGVRHGLPRDVALRALTLAPARQLGLEARIGSLEPGKDADLVVLSGDPFSVHTQVLETWVEGERIYDASDPEQAAYAVGGYDVYDGAGDHVHHGEGLR